MVFFLLSTFSYKFYIWKHPIFAVRLIAGRKWVKHIFAYSSLMLHINLNLQKHILCGKCVIFKKTVWKFERCSIFQNSVFQDSDLQNSDLQNYGFKILDSKFRYSEFRNSLFWFSFCHSKLLYSKFWFAKLWVLKIRKIMFLKTCALDFKMHALIISIRIFLIF